MFEAISSPLQTEVGGTRPSGRIVGTLAEGEDRAAIERALVLAPQLALEAEVELLTHADLDTRMTAEERDRSRHEKLNALRAGKLKRYVLRIGTAAGARIVKIAEVNSFGNVVLGMLGSSVSRKEHALHLRSEELGVAATRTLGYLEWRARPQLIRACQVQTLLADDAESLDTVLREQIETHGDAALECFAGALAATHRVPFFHADLKGFHAFVYDKDDSGEGPASYGLQWIDLARVAFRLSPRQRKINLYQALRFVVPTRPAAQERFMQAYCRAASWCAEDPGRALAKIRQFLVHKYRTHPIA